jgi:hypothetical protein
MAKKIKGHCAIIVCSLYGDDAHRERACLIGKDLLGRVTFTG